MATADGSHEPDKAFQKTLLTAGVFCIIFVLIWATMLLYVAVHLCLFRDNCNQISGLSNLIFAWVGTMLAGILGYLFGSRRSSHRSAR